jgi:hypothetical protein
MNKGALAVIGLVLLGVGALYVAMQAQKAQEANRPLFTPVTQPPAGAAIIDELLTPELAARDPGVVGMWIPHPKGWQGTATKVTLEKDGVAVRIWMPVATLASTGVWVICYFEGVESLSAFPITEGQAIHYGGKASQVDEVSEGPIVAPRLVVRPAYLMK